MHRKFKLKLLTIQLLSILPFLVFIFYLFSLWFDTQRKLIINQNISQAKLTGEFIREKMDNGLSFSALLATDENLYKSAKEDSEKTRSYLVKTIQKGGAVDSVIITGIDGLAVSASFPLTLDQKEDSLSSEPYFHQVLRSKTNVISSPIKDHYSDHQVIVMASPIVKNQEMVGVINSQIDLENLKNMTEKAIYSDENSSIIVLDSDNQIVFIPFKPIPEMNEKNLFVNAAFSTKNIGNNIEIIENQKLPTGSQTVFGASVKLSGLSWKVLSTAPTEMIFLPLLVMEKSVWLIIGVSLIFTLAVISYFLRTVKVVF